MGQVLYPSTSQPCFYASMIVLTFKVSFKNSINKSPNCASHLGKNHAPPEYCLATRGSQASRTHSATWCLQVGLINFLWSTLSNFTGVRTLTSLTPHWWSGFAYENDRSFLCREHHLQSASVRKSEERLVVLSRLCALNQITAFPSTSPLRLTILL